MDAVRKKVILPTCTASCSVKLECHKRCLSSPSLGIFSPKLKVFEFYGICLRSKRSRVRIAAGVPPQIPHQQPFTSNINVSLKSRYLSNTQAKCLDCCGLCLGLVPNQNDLDPNQFYAPRGTIIAGYAGSIRPRVLLLSTIGREFHWARASRRNFSMMS
jgi:hypothetical protein